MTTVWDDMPSEAELELWWVVETKPEAARRAVEEAIWDAEGVAAIVERVETFLREAARPAGDFDVRRRPLGRSWNTGASSGITSLEELDAVAAWAAWRLLDSLCERPRVRVVTQGDGVTALYFTVQPARPNRAELASVIRLGRIRREWAAVRDRTERAPSGRLSAAKESRLSGPPGAA